MLPSHFLHLPLNEMLPCQLHDISHWTDEKIHELVQGKFSIQACYFQLQVTRAIYEGKDVIACAPTGTRKTLSFWIPTLIANTDKRK
jgi:superfamily II DNA/RNA helicase